MVERVSPATAECRAYLSDRLDEAVTDVDVLGDGLNLVAAVSTEAASDAYVLRRPTELRRTDLFNDLRTEYDLLRELRGTGVPAPAPVLFCEDDSVLGAPFFVTTYLDGREVPWGSRLPERFRTPEARGAVARRLVDALADVHAVDVEPFEAVCERQPPREQLDRAVARLDRATSVTGHELPTLRAVGEWLREHAPPEPATALVHGDFKPDNVLLGGGTPPEVTGVLDWETAALGDPRTELGYLLLLWRDEGDPPVPLDGIEAGPEDRRQLEERNERGFWPFTSAPGSPSRRELVARYEAATGTAFEDDRFYRAHAAFMLATVWEELHRHEVEQGGETGGTPHVEYVATLAERIVDGEVPL